MADTSLCTMLAMVWQRSFQMAREKDYGSKGERGCVTELRIFMSTLKIRLDWLLLVCLYTRPKAPTMEAQTRSGGWLEPDINSGKCRFLSWMPANYNVTTHLDPGFGSLLSAVNPFALTYLWGFDLVWPALAWAETWFLGLFPTKYTFLMAFFYFYFLWYL
jgi:hypothetical protein